MDKQEPHEGDEQLGIITEIEETPGFWTLTVPGIPSLRNRAYIHRRRRQTCPVEEQQICMFRYCRWTPGVSISGLYWQPVLDYFESDRPEQ